MPLPLNVTIILRQKFMEQLLEDNEEETGSWWVGEGDQNFKYHQYHCESLLFSLGHHLNSTHMQPENW